MFSTTSRYQGIPTATYHLPDGRTVVYLHRRILPHAEDLAQLGSYTVLPDQRPDLVAFAVFGDAEQWWRLADGNQATDPDELTARPGRVLRVTLPDRIPAAGLIASPSGGGTHG